MSRSSGFFLALTLLAVFLGLATAASAQVDDFTNNFPPFGSFFNGSFDTISLQNGNIHFTIPLTGVRDRKGTIQFYFVYDTALWPLQYSSTATPQFPRDGHYAVKPPSNTSLFRLINSENWQLLAGALASASCTGTSQFSHNVTAITNNRDTTRSPSFTYDALNRILTAKTSSTSGTKCWDEQFGYDPWANLLSISRISGYTCSNEENLSVAVNTRNQPLGYTYDSAGNLINDGAGHAYTFNAENQLLTAAGVTYTYDGDGKRVQKSSGKLYWYGMGSDPLTETDASGNPTAEYIFFNGKRTARLDLPSAAVHYYFSDHLGSASVVTSSAGAIQDESDYYPFGGERVLTNSDPNNYKFTGKERDSESGLDNFKARYFGSSLGRFQTPDPLHIEMHRLFDPQRLNLYAYARNNPLKYTDPTGLDVTCNGNRCDDYLKALQKLAGNHFKVTMDKNGKIGVDDVDKKSLSKSDKALLKAFGDTKHHVSISAIGGAHDSSVFFGASHGSSHTIAFDQTALLDAPKNAGGATTAQIAGHETLEGYAESKGESLGDAHDFANGFFPGFDRPSGGSPGERTATDLLSVHVLLPIHGTGVTENVEFKFDTPIPIESINNGTAQRSPGYPVDVTKEQ